MCGEWSTSVLPFCYNCKFTKNKISETSASTTYRLLIKLVFDTYKIWGIAGFFYENSHMPKMQHDWSDLKFVSQCSDAFLLCFKVFKHIFLEKFIFLLLLFAQKDPKNTTEDNCCADIENWNFIHKKIITSKQNFSFSCKPHAFKNFSPSAHCTTF